MKYLMIYLSIRFLLTLQDSKSYPWRHTDGPTDSEEENQSLQRKIEFLTRLLPRYSGCIEGLSSQNKNLETISHKFSYFLKAVKQNYFSLMLQNMIHWFERTDNFWQTIMDAKQTNILQGWVQNDFDMIWKIDTYALIILKWKLCGIYELPSNSPLQSQMII